MQQNPNCHIRHAALYQTRGADWCGSDMFMDKNSARFIFSQLTKLSFRFTTRHPTSALLSDFQFPDRHRHSPQLTPRICKAKPYILPSDQAPVVPDVGTLLPAQPLVDEEHHQDALKPIFSTVSAGQLTNACSTRCSRPISRRLYTVDILVQVWLRTVC